MRENGFYWVKYRGYWTVAEWDSFWILIGNECLFDDDDMDEIGQKIPEELKWKT